MSALVIERLAPGELTERRRRTAERRRTASVAFSLAAHGLMVLALFSAWPRQPERAFVEEPIGVSLVEGPLLSSSSAPAGAPAAAATPTPAPTPTPEPAPPSAVNPVPARQVERPPPPKVETIAAGEPEDAALPPTLVGLSAGQLVGAATADSGEGAGSGSGDGVGGGAPCNMVRWLQAELRKDPRIQAAVSHAHRVGGSPSGALLLWDGEWLRSAGQSGGGIAGVREAIIMEVGFAPDACRTQQMRGLAVISLSDAPGSPRIALGAGAWRWTDLLKPRRGVGRMGVAWR